MGPFENTDKGPDYLGKGFSDSTAGGVGIDSGMMNGADPFDSVAVTVVGTDF